MKKSKLPLPPVSSSPRHIASIPRKTRSTSSLNIGSTMAVGASAPSASVPSSIDRAIWARSPPSTVVTNPKITSQKPVAICWKSSTNNTSWTHSSAETPSGKNDRHSNQPPSPVVARMAPKKLARRKPTKSAVSFSG